MEHTHGEPALSRPRIAVAPARALVDQPVAITVSGVIPGQRVTVRAQMDLAEMSWEAQATFAAAADGTVDVTTQAPVAGAYTEVDPMGLFWAMDVRGPAGGPPHPPGRPGEPDIVMTFTAETEGRLIATTTLERLLATADVERTTVQERGLAGEYFRPSGPGPHPTILMLGGSGGGMPLPWAALLASHGFATLALAYFRYAHLPAALAAIPLEYFETALGWMAAQAGVRGERPMVVGVSRGGELALLLGATFPQVAAVVAYVPSAYTHGALGGDVAGQAAWTWRGQPLPFIRHAELPGNDDPAAIAAREAAAIPVERINGPILLISGTHDGLWPSSALSDEVMRRLAAQRHPYPDRHLRYEGAGHVFSFPYLPTTVREARHPVTGAVLAFGGDARSNHRAQVDSWPQVLRFLAAQQV